MRGAYRGMTTLLSATMIALGVAILAVTLSHGGGSVGIVLGLMFVAVGAGRIYLLRKTSG
jgi:hypothetical protein